MIEIFKYVPLELKITDANMNLDEFFKQLAIARYVQELEENVLTKAIGRLFEDD